MSKSLLDSHLLLLFAAKYHDTTLLPTIPSTLLLTHP